MTFQIVLSYTFFLTHQKMIDLKYKLFDYITYSAILHSNFAHIFFNYCTMLERTGIVIFIKRNISNKFRMATLSYKM